MNSQRNTQERTSVRLVGQALLHVSVVLAARTSSLAVSAATAALAIAFVVPARRRIQRAIEQPSSAVRTWRSRRRFERPRRNAPTAPPSLIRSCGHINTLMSIAKQAHNASARSLISRRLQLTLPIVEDDAQQLTLPDAFRHLRERAAHVTETHARANRRQHGEREESSRVEDGRDAIELGGGLDAVLLAHEARRVVRHRNRCGHASQARKQIRSPSSSYERASD